MGKGRQISRQAGRRGPRREQTGKRCRQDRGRAQPAGPRSPAEGSARPYAMIVRSKMPEAVLESSAKTDACSNMPWLQPARLRLWSACEAPCPRLQPAGREAHLPHLSMRYDVARSATTRTGHTRYHARGGIPRVPSWDHEHAPSPLQERLPRQPPPPPITCGI